MDANVWLKILLMSVCLGGCARRPMLEDPTTPTEVVSDGLKDRSPRIEPGIYDVARGEHISREALLERLGEARFVVLGETHDDVFHHQVQHEVYDALARRAQAREGVVLLGLEMVQVPFQGALDAYVSGQIDQPQMLEQVEWEERWRFPVEFYAPMWQEARTRRWPVVALNAPREVTRRISQVGLDGLTGEERAQVADELVLDNQAHRAWFQQMFASHGMTTQDEAAFERFYAAQVGWDETMAQSAHRAMESRGEKDQMMIVAGSGHVMNRWGIPSRLERRAPGKSVLTLIPVSAPGGVQRSLAAPSGATEDDLATWQEQGFADFVWVQ